MLKRFWMTSSPVVALMISLSFGVAAMAEGETVAGDSTLGSEQSATFGSTTSSTGDGKTIPLGEATVSALSYYKDANGRSHGACFPMRVVTGGLAPSDVRVAFVDSQVGATGDQWKAAGWMASVMAAQLTDFHPASMQVAFQVRGYIEGPSSGALMTVAILAALRGDTIRADATMTGTINPDGMIGPVAGLPHKIEGAAKAGKKLVLIPMTIEVEQDQNTKKMVQLIEYGDNLGVDVRTVVDIYEAYELMTGVELPQPRVSGRPKIALDVDEILTEKMFSWGDLVTNGVKVYYEVPQNIRADLDNQIKVRGVDAVAKAFGLMKEGAVTAAYADMIEATVVVYVAKEYAQSRQILNSQGVEGMVRRIKDNQWLDDVVKQTATAIKFAEPTTLNQLAMYFNLCDVFLEAIAVQKLADKMLANLPTEREKRINAALSAATWQIVSWLDCKIAMDELELMQTYGGNPIPADAPFIETAQFYNRAILASLKVFESLVIDEVAKSLQVDKAEAEKYLAQKDTYYGLMWTAQNEVVQSLEDYFGDGPQLAYAKVAASIHVHTRAALLVAKYYSLDAQMDDEMFITGIGRERTFNEWLSESEGRAKRNIMLLDKYGIDTSTYAQLYEHSKILQNRGMNEKLKALTVYFSLNVSTKIIQRLSGVNTVASRNVVPRSREIAPPPLDDDDVAPGPIRDN